jgi:HK97 gp10 family phage protein
MAKLQSNLTHIALQAPGAAKAALLSTAADIVDVAKQLVPVDTGALKQSIGAIPVSSTTVHIGTDKIYGPYVEYGTTHQSAQPYLTPAFMQAESTFKARLKEEAEKLG